MTRAASIDWSNYVKAQRGDANSAVVESDIEAYLCLEVRRIGGQAYKFISPQRRNVPDRIVLLPGGRVFFAELKAPGKKPSAGQLREHARLLGLGHVVRVLCSYQDVSTFIASVEGA